MRPFCEVLQQILTNSTILTNALHNLNNKGEDENNGFNAKNLNFHFIYAKYKIVDISWQFSPI